MKKENKNRTFSEPKKKPNLSLSDYIQYFEAGWTLEKIAQKMGKSKSTISELRKKWKEKKKQESISKILNVDTIILPQGEEILLSEQEKKKKGKRRDLSKMTTSELIDLAIREQSIAQIHLFKQVRKFNLKTITDLTYLISSLK